ncbi:unnamed protein product [Rotaria socialis]|uniref:Uncharacterized protein n=1 Tax=Rotaria socialis TaxID=392032 RepID=A0A820UXK8_9BILA|nr:unnamed protein product [Rotaria socialis]
MTRMNSVSPPSLASIHSSILSESVSIASRKASFDIPYNISYLLKRIRGQQNFKVKNLSSEYNTQEKSVCHEPVVHQYKSLLNNNIKLADIQKSQYKTDVSTPILRRSKIKQLNFDRLKRNTNVFTRDQLNKQYHIQRQKSNKRFFKNEKDEKQEFNNAAYCVAYCTIIVIGVTIGGWIGGLFELISSGHNGCSNEYRGHLKCQAKYKSLNVTTHCINIFYKNSILHNAPFICLCRFRNNSQGKYRDCEFLHANIQYI